MTQIAEIVDRLRRLAKRREDEGIYTDAALCEEAAMLLDEHSTAAIGAGGQAVAADIGDAVLGWMVKYDLLDGDNEYQVADVMAVMDDLVPSSALSQPHPADERVVGALDEGLSILTNLIDNIKRHGNYSAESTCMFIDQAGASIRAARRALTGGKVDG